MYPERCVLHIDSICKCNTWRFCAQRRQFIRDELAEVDETDSVQGSSGHGAIEHLQHALESVRIFRHMYLHMWL